MRERDFNYNGFDYSDIGTRIREERLRQGINQELLAEMAELSTTHMSHIETGSTKLSLPALHRLAWELGVSLDALACDSIKQAKGVFEDELLRHTEDCDDTEIRIIVDTIKALKGSLRKRII